jgi:hypothetical protein
MRARRTLHLLRVRRMAMAARMLSAIAVATYSEPRLPFRGRSRWAPLGLGPPLGPLLGPPRGDPGPTRAALTPHLLARDRLRFLPLREGDEDVLVQSGPAVLVQRTTAPEQSRRRVVADLSPEALHQWGGRLIVENHVSVLRPTVGAPLLTRETLSPVLATDELDRVMRSLSGSVAVSAHELESVPFPGRRHPQLRGWNGLTGPRLARAVAAAYRPGD